MPGKCWASAPIGSSAWPGRRIRSPASRSAWTAAVPGTQLRSSGRALELHHAILRRASEAILVGPVDAKQDLAILGQQPQHTVGAGKAAQLRLLVVLEAVREHIGAIGLELDLAAGLQAVLHLDRD